MHTQRMNGQNEKGDHRTSKVKSLTDALEVGYLYQQKPGIRLPHCVKEDSQTDTTNGKVKTSSENVSKVARQTYKELGLTRDVVVLKGNLEAHLFQTADLMITAPPAVKQFVVLYQVECDNCRWFYRTESFGQLVQLE